MPKRKVPARVSPWQRNWTIFRLAGMVVTLKVIKWPAEFETSAAYAIAVLERLLASVRASSSK